MNDARRTGSSRAVHATYTWHMAAVGPSPSTGRPIHRIEDLYHDYAPIRRTPAYITHCRGTRITARITAVIVQDALTMRRYGGRLLAIFGALAAICIVRPLPSIEDLRSGSVHSLQNRNQNTLPANTTASRGGSQAVASSKFAYAFLIAGCNPADSSSYRGYIYNIMASSFVLRHQNSTSDIVALVKMSSKTNATALPAIEAAWLTKSGVRIHYIPKVEDER